MPDIDIYHFNDFHRRLEPCADGQGGAARLSTVLKRAQAENPDALVLNGGDVAGDNAEHGPDAFSPIASLFNEMGVDVIGLGNHEFEDPTGSYEGLRKSLIEPFEGDVLAANVHDGKGALVPGTRPYVMKQVEGVSVAILGVVTRDLASAMFPAAGAGLRVAPIEDTLRSLVPKVRAEGAEVVIVMSHQGLNETRGIAREVDGVDLFLAAHDHRQTEAPFLERSPDGRAVAVAEAGGYGRNVGHVRISVDDATRRVTGVFGSLIPVTPDVEPDPKVQAIVDRWEPPARAERPAPRKWRSVSLDQLASALTEGESTDPSLQ